MKKTLRRMVLRMFSILFVLIITFNTVQYAIPVYADSKPFGFPAENLNAKMTCSYSQHSNKNGYDLSFPQGTPIYAIFDGVATYYQSYHKDTKKSMSYGNYIEIKSNDGTYSVIYAHLSAFEGVALCSWIICGVGGGYTSGVTLTETVASKTVKAGQLIGYTGNTGNSTGPHLHLGLKKNGIFVDPEQYISRDWCAKDYVDHNPVIVLDECSSPSTGVLRVKGWAYDPDSPNEPVNVHIYFGDYCVDGKVYTGTYRPDVPQKGYPCGPNQGFEADLFTWKAYGTREVSAYAINIGAGDDAKAKNTYTVTVAQDTTSPSLYNPKVTDITSSSYTITVNAKDDVGVSEVKMPSWTVGQTGNDAVWHLASRPNTDTFYCTIPKTSGMTSHWTHVYAYDRAGNSTCGEIRLDDVKVTFNANGGKCSTGSKTLTSVTAFENYINPYGTLPTPTRSGYSFAGWYTAADGGTKVTGSTIISNRSNHTLYAHWTQDTYVLDLQGEFSGELRETINWIGTVDVYINDVLVADDVIDYNARHPAGTKYEIKDIRVYKSISYNGIYSGTRVGTMEAQDTKICLSYNRIKPEEFAEEPRVTMALDGHVYEFYDTPVTWYTAMYTCEYKGGHLAAITSEAEYKALATYFNNARLWIGATDQDKEGYFVWTTGENFSFSAWKSGEPGNHATANAEGEHYVAMCENGDGWADFTGTNKFGFICEYDSCAHKYVDTTVAPTGISQGYDLHTCTVCGYSYKDNYTDPIYLLDLQAELNGNIRENINWIGTVDVYINDVLVADDVIDYNARHPAGTKYEIKDIRVSEYKDISYNGIYSGKRVGTIGNEDTTICLSYNTIKPENFTDEPGTTVVLDGHVYEFYETPVTWYTARYICEYKGGHLAAITSEKEYETLATYFKDSCLWIGATDEVEEGNFTWLTGESFVYSNWYAGEPNNLSGDEDARESYVAMRPGGQQWSDFNGTRTFGFICEYETCTHKYEDTTVAPTCTDRGYIIHACTVCGHNYKDSYTDATDHSYTYKVAADPTVSSTGALTGTCSKCAGTTTVTLPKLNTTDYTKTTTKASTCTATGTDSYKWNVTTYGTFTFTEETSAKGHTSVTDKAVAATCTATGLTEGSHCSVCNAVIKAQTTVTALGHSYTSKVTAPTCTALGYTTYICSRCNISYEDEYIPVVAHSYTNGICSSCGEEEVITGVLEDLTWAYYVAHGKLIVSGEGSMPSYSAPGKYPWYAYNAAMKTVTIEKGVTSIGSYGFYNCTKLTGVEIAETVETIGDYAFLNCGVLTDVILPEGLTTIGNFAFNFCYELTEVTIPGSVTNVGEGVFAGCSKLLSIKVAGNNAYYSNDDHGVLFNKDKTTLIAYPCGLEGSYAIPNTVTALADSSFYYCTELTDVTIPDSVVTIGTRGFARCEKLGPVTIPAGVVSIGGSAFRYCQNMDHVHFIGDMPAMGTNAFANGATNLKLCYLAETQGWENCSYSAELWDHAYTIDGENITYICNVCGKSYSCELKITEPITDEAIVINHSLNLASDISINYAVKADLLTAYDSFYLEIQRPVYSGNAMTGFKTIKIDPVLTGNYYYFTMTDITAVNMNDELVAILHMTKGKQEYISKTDSYSIVTYALNQLNKDTAADKLKTLCADLLRYGAAAQNFKGYRTDAGATVPMTDANRAWFSDINAVTFGNTNMVHNDLTNPLITWAGKTLNLESKVVVKFIFNAGAYTGNVSNLTLRMVYRDNSGIYRTVTLTDPAVYNEAKRQYAFEFDGLLAAELRTALSVAVYSGDEQLSPTLQYSPDTYGNNKTGNLGELCKALFAYSDSAKAYFS